VSIWAVMCGLAVAGLVHSSMSGEVAHRLRGPAHGAQSPGRLGWSGAAVVAVGLASWSLAEGTQLNLFVVVAIVPVCLVVRGITGGWRFRRERRARQVAVIEVCDALASELHAGLPAGRALERACEGRPDWAPIVSAGTLGGGVAAAMRLAARVPGAEGLRAVAAGWEVSDGSGAGLAAVLERIAAGLRSDDDARAEVTACLGPVRATATMLAVLPVFGLALGSSMGARPVAFLLSTTAGGVCLILGLTLASAGVLWVERLASAAEV
jgi:tight adherence protein B